MTLVDAPIPVTVPLTDTIYIMGSIAVATAAIVLYLTREFSRTRGMIFDSRKLFYKIISRHNREDDEMFAHLNAQVYQLQARNARKDGLSVPPMKPIPRRRYLIDDGAGEEDDEEPI